ncbi:hypothetical protein HGO41_21630 [Rahnella sp. CG8]|uniref:hypothetical protein n=1 Tax=Rahnella sp. CG8 TaxID=2726078 RepID=UPI002033D221|nr:hypothetical protein [Rahnella sp. CG8]MCM2447762.1 hypothetical protein [Rahnella sp. CG8]
MQNVTGQSAISTRVLNAAIVSKNELSRISENANAIRAKAMELTDSWEGVMFALPSEDLERIALALGFTPEVAENIHNEIRSLGYAKTQSMAGPASIATYHASDVSLLALRGVTDFDNALSHVNDSNLQQLLNDNQDTFQRIRNALPEHAARMNFKPETAAAVLKSLGANISPDLLYEICPKYGTSSVIDLEGRRGVTTEFIRCVTLTLGTTVS